MKKGLVLGISMALVAILLLTARPKLAEAGMGVSGSDFKVLPPISHGDLTIFPIVASKVHDASDFLTLDEGIRSGDVVVTEVGNIHPLIRRHTTVIPPQGSGGVVNRLVLVNNSKHPLILLAGEVVTGGKQDRVVGKDRIVPAESDPVDLSVFCVEHGRWTETSAKFDTHASVMLQPSVRMKAMAEKDQQKVWDEVGKSRTAMASKAAAAAPPVSGGSGGGAGGGTYSVQMNELSSTTSYAKARE